MITTWPAAFPAHQLLQSLRLEIRFCFTSLLLPPDEQAQIKINCHLTLSYYIIIATFLFLTFTVTILIHPGHLLLPSALRHFCCPTLPVLPQNHWKSAVEIKSLPPNPAQWHHIQWRSISTLTPATTSLSMLQSHSLPPHPPPPHCQRCHYSCCHRLEPVLEATCFPEPSGDTSQDEQRP